MGKLKRILAVLLSMAMLLSVVSISAAAVDISQELRTANAELSRKVAGEGMVLLKNDNNGLPLAKGERVAVFGGVGSRFYKGGDGSGNVKVEYVRDVLQGMQIKEAEGKVAVNADLAKNYNANNGYNPPANIIRTAATNSDTAIVTISRNSGEGGDTSANKGDYYLSAAEETLLQNVCGAGFKNIVVVLNIGRVIDTSWIANYPAINSVLLAWQPGMEGGLAIADILCGEVTPSGKLTDTFAKSYTDYVTSEGFNNNYEYTDYTEDVYVGYRWFETFDPNYEKVNYEFGYGLSYTSFRMSGQKVTNDGENITVSVDVKNDGDYAGKEVVQVYFSAPQGKLGKPAKELAGFKKTDLLQPGEKQTVKISFPISDMSSYDDTGKVAESAYVLEKGVYNIYVGNSIKDAGKRGVKGTYEVKEDTVTEQLSRQSEPYQLEKRLLSDGSYETLDTYKEMTEADGFVALSADSATRIEAEESWYKQRYSRAEYNADNSICGLRIYSENGDGRDYNWVEFAVNAPAAGNYELRLGFGVDPAYILNNAVTVQVDGVNQPNAGTINLTSTGARWTISEFGPLTVNLEKGNSLVRIVFNTDNEVKGAFDYITLTPAGVDYKTPATKYVATPDPANTAGELTFFDVYEDPELLDEFVDQMTYAQLAELLTGKYGNNEGLSAAQGTIGNMGDFSIPSVQVCDGPAGVDWGGTATAWPIGTAVACTWNPELIEEMGAAFAKECIEVGVDIILTPGINTHRNPLCGRNFEYMSEDPLVAGLMSAALVRGLEGGGVKACVKHFVANERENQRYYTETRVSERALREIYLKAFEISIKNSDPSFVMSSYNRVNGYYTSESYELLTNILRNEWGFKGTVFTDWWNSGNQPIEIAAGNDIKMQTGYVNEVIGALASGRLSREAAVTSATRVLKVILATDAVNRMLDNMVVHEISATGTNRVKAIETTWKDGNIGSEACQDTDGGNNPTNTYGGAWLSYYLDVEKAGTYVMKARVASPGTTGTIEVTGDGIALGTIANSAGSGWQTWFDTAEIKIQLPAGRTELRLTYPSDAINTNWFELTYVNTDEQVTITPVETKVAPGSAKQLEATGEVNWSVKGNKSAATKIDANGKLTVGEDETAKTLLIYATAVANSDAVDVIKVQIGATQAATLVGDVDGDGNVNVSDIIKVKNLIMAGEWSDAELAAGDMNNSGKLDVADIIAIKNLIMGA